MIHSLSKKQRKRKLSQVDNIRETSIRKEPLKRCHPEFDGQFPMKLNSIKIGQIHLSSLTEDSQLQNVPESSFGRLVPITKPTEASNKQENSEESIAFYTDEQLNDRVALSDVKKYPVFKKYSVGEASCRLYVKNLNKKVTEADLKAIFGRFALDKEENLSSAFFVQLLKGGRMHGQAFITFPKMECAAHALQRTNGLLLHGKPIVVCYARSLQASVDSKMEGEKEAKSRNSDVFARR